jgi:hypothetical protein
MLNQDMVDEYSFNLRNFIRDVRLDLDAPDLPFGKPKVVSTKIRISQSLFLIFFLTVLLVFVYKQ